MLRRALMWLAVLALVPTSFGQSSRRFTFRYDFTVKAVPAGKPLRIWIPEALSDDFQTVKVTKTTGDLPLRKAREKRYGNEIFYAEAPASASEKDYHFDIEYEVVRRERVTLTEAESKAAEVNDSFSPKRVAIKSDSLRQSLAPNKFVPTTGLPAELASKAISGRNGTISQARGIYDYVFANMKYDKSGTGWGHGDTLWACDTKRGNCTDFHSLFISMARSQGIPARFEIGFPIPAAKHEGDIAGYHCWAEFYAGGKGWIPVDISEAWKDQSKKDYFFGEQNVNRVQFTLGRDLTLNPPQAGQPLNYFVFPYVEVDGKKYGNVSNHFTFSDIPAVQHAAGGQQ